MSMRKIYRQIAKKHGVTVAEVKRDMQAAIDQIYKYPIISNNTGNNHSQTVIAATITSKTVGKAKIPTHCKVRERKGVESKRELCGRWMEWHKFSASRFSTYDTRRRSG